jgi:hypothetical protein
VNIYFLPNFQNTSMDHSLQQLGGGISRTASPKPECQVNDLIKVWRKQKTCLLSTDYLFGLPFHPTNGGICSFKTLMNFSGPCGVTPQQTAPSNILRIFTAKPLGQCSLQIAIRHII